MGRPFHALERIRLIGAGVFLVAGVVPMVNAALMVVLAPGTGRSEDALRA